MAKQNAYKGAFGISIALRVLAAAACVASSWTMLTNHQNVQVYRIPMVAKYTYVSSFKLMAYANVVAGVLAVITLGASMVVPSKRMSPNAFFLLFVHDLAVMTMVMAGSSAATAEGNLGKYGNPHSGWIAICGYFGHFCSRATISIALSYSAFILFLALTLISAFLARPSPV